MATYKNISVGAHVHAGKVYAPGQSFEADPAPGLDKLVKIGVLEVSGNDVSQDDSGKDALFAELDAAGAKYDKRWGVEKLQAALAESKKG